MPITQTLLDRLRNNDPDITELNLSQQISSEDDVINLVDALQNNTHVQVLIIQGKHGRGGRSILNNQGVQLIAEKLKIRELDISCNNIDDCCLDSLLANESLRELTLHSTQKLFTVSGLLKFLDSHNLYNLVGMPDCHPPKSIDEMLLALRVLEIGIPESDVRVALSGDIEAKIRVIAYLNAIYECGYNQTKEYFESDTENKQIISFLNDFIMECWDKKVTSILKENRARDDAVFAKQLELEKLSQAALDAIEEENEEKLLEILLQLPDGANTLLENGHSCLMSHCLWKDKVKSARVLLNAGYRVETHHREYTPLQMAAEEGKLEFVKLFLRWSANITGEFYFNSETALSIAAFKLCNELVRMLAKYNGEVEKWDGAIKSRIDKFKAMYRAAFDRANSVPSAMMRFNTAAASISCFVSGDDTADTIWKVFSKDEKLWGDLSRSALSLARTLMFRLKKPGDEAEVFEDLSTRMSVYRLIHDKHAIIKGRPAINEKMYFAELGGEYAHRLQLPVAPEPSVKVDSEQALATHLARLNAELKEKKEADIDWSKYPILFVAQYRGIHYYRKYFNEQQCKEHSQTNHLARMTAALAVYYMSSLEPGQHELARESVLLYKSAALQVMFDYFYQSGPVVHPQTKKQYPSLGHVLQERMSNDYAGFKDDVEHRKNVASEILSDLRAFGYPTYAMSDFVDHALRYAYGLKPINGLRETLVKPNYDNEGKPKNAVLGKVSIALFTPLQMMQERAKHVAGMHNREQMQIHDSIAPERETGIAGGLEPGYIFYEEALEVPDLSTWDESYLDRFGLSENDVRDFRSGLSKTHDKTSLEKTIVGKIKAHKESQLLDIAHQEAQRRGGYLIYRPHDREYKVQLEAMKGMHLASKHERELMSKASQKFWRSLPSSEAVTGERGSEHRQGSRPAKASRTAESLFGAATGKRKSEGGAAVEEQPPKASKADESFMRKPDDKGKQPATGGGSARPR